MLFLSPLLILDKNPVHFISLVVIDGYTFRLLASHYQKVKE